MYSTSSFGMAFYKAQEATQMPLPTEGTVLITVDDDDKAAIVEPARLLAKEGFTILATQGTREFLLGNNIPCERVLKMSEGRPHLVDVLKNGGIQLVINTPGGRHSKHDDAYIRKAAIRYKIPYITTASAAFAAARGIADKLSGASTVRSLQDYHKDIA